MLSEVHPVLCLDQGYNGLRGVDVNQGNVTC